MKNRLKVSKTIKDYSVKYGGYDLLIPSGSLVSNNTACGYDDNYRFLMSTHAIAKEATGFSRSILEHDLIHYGLNIPAEYCQPYDSRP